MRTLVNALSPFDLILDTILQHTFKVIEERFLELTLRAFQMLVWAGLVMHQQHRTHFPNIFSFANPLTKTHPESQMDLDEAVWYESGEASTQTQRPPHSTAYASTQATLAQLPSATPRPLPARRPRIWITDTPLANRTSTAHALCWRLAAGSAPLHTRA